MNCCKHTELFVFLFLGKNIVSLIHLTYYLLISSKDVMMFLLRVSLIFLLHYKQSIDLYKTFQCAQGKHIAEISTECKHKNENQNVCVLEFKEMYLIRVQENKVIHVSSIALCVHSVTPRINISPDRFYCSAFIVHACSFVLMWSVQYIFKSLTIRLFS